MDKLAEQGRLMHPGNKQAPQKFLGKVGGGWGKEVCGEGGGGGGGGSPFCIPMALPSG